MFKKAAAFAIKFRLIILILLLGSTAFMAYKGTHLTMSYKLAQLLPKTDSSYIAYENFKAQFGEDGSMVIIAVKDKDFWKKENFDKFLDFTTRLKQLEGISRVASLKNAVILHKDDSLMQFVPVNLVQEGKTYSAEQIDSIRIELFNQPLYNKLLYNANENSYLILATLDKEVINSKARIPLVDNIDKLLAEYKESANVETHISGLPYIRTVNVKMGQREITLFIGLAALVTAIVLIIIFNSFWEVIVPLLMVAISVFWAQGLIVLLDYKVTILTGLVPPLLIVIGVPNSIYIITKYHREINIHKDKTKALIHVIDKAGSAVFMANLTTAIGFGTFMFTNSQILQEFGLVASVNVLLLFFLSILFIPILFSYLPIPSQRSTSHLDRKLSLAMVRIFILLSQHYRKAVFIGAAAVIAFSLYGISKIQVKGSMVDDMPEENTALQDLHFFEKTFGGVMPLEILIDTKREKAVVRDQKLWKKIDELQEYINNQTIYARPLSIVELYKVANQAFYDGDPNSFEVPSRLDAPFIIDYVKGDAGQDTLLKSMTDSLKSVARVSVQMKNLNTNEISVAVEDIRKKAEEIFDPETYDVTITGAAVSYMNGTKYLINNLFQSLFLAVFLIALFMGVQFKNIKIVLMSLIPNMIPALLTAGLMGYFGIPIKPSTVLVFSIAFGISVDDTIHYLTRFRQEMKTHSGNIRSSVIKALRETAMSMAYTSIVLFFGFSVFAASNFGGTKALGLLVSLTLVSAMTTNLVLLPSLLMLMHKKNDRKIARKITNQLTK